MQFVPLNSAYANKQTRLHIVKCACILITQYWYSEFINQERQLEDGCVCVSIPYLQVLGHYFSQLQFIIVVLNDR
jgi:hypothetical protein